MAELTAKERIIKEVYENREQGYGSIKDTFQQAKAKDASIKLDDVKKYFIWPNNRTVKHNSHTKNSIH